MFIFKLTTTFLQLFLQTHLSEIGINQKPTASEARCKNSLTLSFLFVLSSLCFSYFLSFFMIEFFRFFVLI